MAKQSSNPNESGVVWRRRNLPHNSKNLRLVLRPRHYQKLKAMASTDPVGRQEPIAAVVERLIDEVELLRKKSLGVHLPREAA